ncbi:hypothetical protein [Halanaerobaculum tunisiense]
MLAVVNEYQKTKGSDKDMKNLLISVGCLVIENYAQIIVQYNNQLNSKLKRQLTLLVNNLQICSQLQSRISGLEEGISESEVELSNLSPEASDKREEIINRKERLTNSLNRKQDKLSQLNQENVNFLLKIGRGFYEERLLQDDEEFSKLYKQLDFLQDKSCTQEEIKQEDFDINVLNLSNLLPV